MTQQYRTNGALGALLDEYERALLDLIDCIESISDDQLTQVVDATTNNEECRSVQTILGHIVQSGYTYVLEIRKAQGENIQYRDVVLLDSVSAYVAALQEMFRFTEQLVTDYPDLQLVAYDCSQKLVTRWGQHFDPEQLFQHAIVHILRHRRQIEKFKLELAK